MYKTVIKNFQRAKRVTEKIDSYKDYESTWGKITLDSTFFFFTNNYIYNLNNSKTE